MPSETGSYHCRDCEAGGEFIGAGGREKKRGRKGEWEKGRLRDEETKR